MSSCSYCTGLACLNKLFIFRFQIDELPDDLNDIINAISAVTLDPSSMNVNLETVEQRKQEVMQFIRNIHRSRSNVENVSNFKLIFQKRLEQIDFRLRFRHHRGRL